MNGSHHFTRFQSSSCCSAVRSRMAPEVFSTLWARSKCRWSTDSVARRAAPRQERKNSENMHLARSFKSSNIIKLFIYNILLIYIKLIYIYSSFFLWPSCPREGPRRQRLATAAARPGGLGVPQPAAERQRKAVLLGGEPHEQIHIIYRIYTYMCIYCIYINMYVCIDESYRICVYIVFTCHMSCDHIR